MKNWPKTVLVAVGFLGLGVGGYTLITLSSNATQSSATPLAQISRAPVTEIPAVASALVRQASAENRGAVARQILEAITALEKPCALPYVVGSIAREAPQAAPAAVVAAAELQPRESVASVRSAVAAAPQKAGDILFSFAQKFPSAAIIAAQAAAGACPEKSAEIVMGVGRAIPGLQPYAAQALQQNVGAVKVEVVLQRAAEMAASAAAEQARTEAARQVAENLSHQPPASPLQVNPQGSVTVANLNNLVNTELARAEKSASAAQSSVGSGAFALQFPAKVVSPGSLQVLQPSQLKVDTLDSLTRPNNYGGGP